MTTIHGGDRVKGGFYWRPAEWQIVTVSGASGVLPGRSAERYRRVPAPALLLLAPVMGGLFVAFLPFIGFAIVLAHAGPTALGAARRTVRRLAAAARPRPPRRGPAPR